MRNKLTVLSDFLKLKMQKTVEGSQKWRLKHRKLNLQVLVNLRSKFEFYLKNLSAIISQFDGFHLREHRKTHYQKRFVFSLNFIDFSSTKFIVPKAKNKTLHIINFICLRLIAYLKQTVCFFPLLCSKTNIIRSIYIKK